MTNKDKAKAYAKKELACIINRPAHPLDELAPYFDSKDIQQAYLAGATEALASQWKDPNVELPETDADVVAIDANGLYIAAYFNGEWYSCDDEFTCNPQMWLPIPPLKGGSDTFDETDK